LMNQFPIAVTALCILLCLCGVIERKLDVMEGSQVIVFQNDSTMAVGSDGELDRLTPQVSEYPLEFRMHSILARAQVHGPNWKTFHHCRDLIEGKTIGAGGIPVAEGAFEVALVRESETKRNTGA